MSNKKAARRRGDNITYFVDGISGQLIDWNPSGSQVGMPSTIRYHEWEKKYQDRMYLIVDELWKKPPVIVPSKESLEKIKAGLQKPEAKASAKPSEKREEALRGVVRRVGKWEGSQAEQDFEKAKNWAAFVVELWPDLTDEILKEFERASGK